MQGDISAEQAWRAKPSLGWRRALALAMLLLAVVAVLAGGWDEPVKGWLTARQQEAWSLSWAVTAYWAGLGGMQGAVLALLALAGWRLSRPAWLRGGLAGLGALALAGLAVQAVKHLVGRPRPRLALPSWEYLGPTLQSDWHSFPSGHAATSFASAAVLASFFPRAGWAFHLAAALISAGRVAGGSHYLSDVLAGALLGLCLGWPLAALAARWRSSSA